MRAALVRELALAPTVSETDEPQPAPGETLVELEAVALNPLDLAVANGRFYGGHPPLPYAPGCEAVGRTPDGTRVYLFGDGRGIAKPGFLCERVAVPSDLPLALPEGASPAVAAVAGIVGVAAWVSVAWRARLEPSDRVLVLGASGSVGLVAIQAAKLLGAGLVVAAARDAARLERAGQLGADKLVILGDPDALAEAFGGDGFTVCIDPLWGEPLADALAAAARHARVIHLGQSAGPTSPLRSADVRGKELEVRGHSNFALTAEERNRAYLELLDHLRAGRITIELERFPLERVADAWQHQSSGGKAVVEF